MNNQIKIQAKEENNILIIPSRIGKELENSNLISYEDFVPYAFNRELVTSLEIDKPKDVIVNVNGQDIKAKAYTVIEVNQLRNTDINIMNDMEEVKMENTKMYKLKVDTENRKFTLDGNDIGKSTTRINIDVNSELREHPKVIIEMDSNVIMEGTLLLGNFTKCTCEFCNLVLGELVGAYAVVCPACEKLNVKY